MKYTTKKQKIDFLLELIIKGNAGTADELSNRLCMHKRTLYRYINELRELNYKISYCRLRKTYYLISE